MEILLKDSQSFVVPDDKDKAAKYIANIFRNSGKIDTEDGERKIGWESFLLSSVKEAKDAITTANIRPLLAASMEVILREPIEPLMVLTSLFNKINVPGMQTKALAGALGAVTAGDVQEGGTYPEVNFQIGGGVQTAWVGKSGISASFSDEALRYSTWDIMGYNIRLMQNALIRHKELKAASFLRNLGVPLFDNLAPAKSLFGVCTGRGLDMAANGSLTLEDLFKAMIHGQEEGFPYDTMLLSPQFFFLFMGDPVLKNMMLAHGGGAFFQRPNGTLGPLDPWSNGALGATGPSRGNIVVPGGSPSGEKATGIVGREHSMTAAPSIPSYFPFPFRIVVSPFMPFDADSGLGDIFLVSSGNIGFHLVDENPVMVEWRNEDVETVKVKIRESYGFAVLNDGQGIGVLKNIPLTKNYWDGTIKATTTAVTSEIAADADLSSVL